MASDARTYSDVRHGGNAWGLSALLLAVLLLLSSPAVASEPYLPPGSQSCQTWRQLYLDQRYETEKWYEATFSEYEQCQNGSGHTLLLAYPRPPDGLYCYYYSLYMHNRAIAWMIVNAGLALQTLDCAWVDTNGLYRGVDLRCEALQRDFGLFTH